MKRFRLLFFVLAMALTLSVTVFATETEARDVSFENSLAADLKGLGLFSGVSDTNFDLERAPSRTEVLVMLIRVLGEEKTATEGEYEHPFTDVPEWADPYVGYAYETGLTKGISETKFGNDTASAATYLTFMLRTLGYSDSKGDFAWDAPYALAEGLGLLPSIVDTENFWRADIVTVSYAALSVELKNSTQLLYEKLIEKGAFTADVFGKNYTATKLTDKENEGKTVLTAEQIYENCSPAVFYIEIQTTDGTAVSSGSGFFVDKSGIAVTNWHVMDGAEKAVITLSGSGAKYDVTDVFYYSIEHDVAVIKVNGTDFKTLDVNPLPVKGASTVYAIGSPKGLQNTISQGIISNTRRIVDGETYIQTTAAISNGSSGGVLLNAYGEAIGITSASYTDGQNLNFARPISYLATSSTDVSTPLAETNWNHVTYELDAQAYTVKAGDKLTFEFDAVIYTEDGEFPSFKAESDNTDVAIAAAAFGDTFVNIVGVKPGTANITISDDRSSNSVTFTVTVTEGEEKELPYVEYFTNIDSLTLNKGAKKTLFVTAVGVGVEGDATIQVTSGDSKVAKLSNTQIKEGYITVDVSALKNGETEIVVTCDKTADQLIIPVNIGEQFYASFDILKDYTIANGEFNDAEDDAKDYYILEGIIYSGGDQPNLVYYPESDTLYLRVTSVLVSGTMDIVLTRETATTGKRIDFVIDYPLYSLYAKTCIKNPSSFGDGKDGTVKFDEYEGVEEARSVYENLATRFVVILLYEIDEWLRYITPDVDTADFGFTSVDYDYYGIVGAI